MEAYAVMGERMKERKKSYYTGIDEIFIWYVLWEFWQNASGGEQAH